MDEHNSLSLSDEGGTNTPPDTSMVADESPGLVISTSVIGYPRSMPFSKAVD